MGFSEEDITEVCSVDHQVKSKKLKIRFVKLRYGFVEFDDLRDADDAVYELNGKDLCGGYGYRRSGRDKYGPPTRTEYRLIVENLSSRCSWQDLKDYMRQAGEVTYADAHKGRKNEGVIEFVSYSDMKRALEKLDGTEVNGRKIRLVEDKPGSRRRRSYSRSRSHSRYSSYSGVETLSYLAAVLQMGQAFVNKTHMVRALMKLNLAEKTGIEQIITIVISMSKGKYAAQLVRRAGRGFPKDMS
ncbi:Serine/arginine-rich splicing factor 4, partial [Eschrichtius robustus]|nr:Serine/arginine-rich splicing factor 4 [Eschrichtius robustus]